MAKQDNPHKKTIAIIYGNCSHEHDVSVVTALQIYGAIDTSQYDPLLVYIAPDGRWFIGDALKERTNYIFDIEAIKSLTQVTLDTNRPDGMQRVGRLLHTKRKLFQNPIAAQFDAVIPAFHGSFGEDGAMQGLLDQLNIPYAGMRKAESAITMNKVTSKYLFNGLGIKTLPFAELRKKGTATILSEDEITAAINQAGIDFPCILKPTNLGSSIGVAKVNNAREVAACLSNLFTLDTSAILEPFVENLVEYNASIHAFDGKPTLSAIERPKATEELLDFKQKYLSGAGKAGSKTGGSKSGTLSQGMLSLTRELNPDLPAKMKAFITETAHTLFTKLPCTGAPRIDFIANSVTNEIWINEINPFPGSSGYFLWEAAPDGKNLLFTELLNHMIDEAFKENKKRRLPKDPVPKDARILKRSLSE